MVQIMAHSARTFSTPRNLQELALEAARLFDLSEHRFHHLLSQSVGCFEAAVVDLLLRIRWVSGPPIFPFAPVGCLARPGAT